MVADSATDGRVQRGNETRRAVLGRAVQIASVEGPGALSTGRSAADRAARLLVTRGLGHRRVLSEPTVVDNAPAFIADRRLTPGHP